MSYYLIWQQRFLKLRKVNKTIKGFSLCSLVRRLSESKTEMTTYFRYIRHYFNLFKTSTRNKTRILGLGKGEFTKTRIQVEARGSYHFSPVPPHRVQTSPSPASGLLPRILQALSLPQLPRQATGTQQNPFFSCTGSLLPSIFSCITHPAPAPVWWVMTFRAWHTRQPKGRKPRDYLLLALWVSEASFDQVWLYFPSLHRHFSR